MAEHDPVPAGPPPDVTARSNLTLRVISALILAPLAIAAAYGGGIIFIVFWGIAALGIFWEWRRIIGDTQLSSLALGIAAILFAMVEFGRRGGLITAADLVQVIVVTVFLAFLSALSAPERRLWIAGGIVYASALLVSVGLLRADAGLGFTAILFLFAIVWATDILGYFVGRLIGGPKLCPRLSPNKTWSGAVGGALGAVLAGAAVSGYSWTSNWPATVGLGLLLSAVSQVGDLFESAVKRRFGAKDAGHVIPGHGGFMDRLDGFLAAALAAAILGVLHGGLDMPARGLLVW